MTTKCDEQISSGGNGYFFHSCGRTVVAGSVKCRLHSPDAVAARREKSQAAYEAKRVREHLGILCSAANILRKLNPHVADLVNAEAEAWRIAIDPSVTEVKR